MGARRRYTESEKKAALTLAKDTTPAHAARETGITLGTIESWLTRERSATGIMAGGITPVSANRAPDGTPLINGRPVVVAPIAMPLDARRSLLADELGDLAALGVATARAFLSMGYSKEALESMRTSDLAIAKAELLQGRATSRQESSSIQTALAVLIDMKGREIPSRGLPNPRETVVDLPERSVTER